MELKDFWNSHAGETALLVGNGSNLELTPPRLFPFLKFGMNTIHLLDGFAPDYYVAVDSRVYREFGDEISSKFRDIPKFIPFPNLDKWQGENFYRFYHRPGALFPYNGRKMDCNLLSGEGITYGNVMHVAIQIAAWMGYSRLLLIGVQHKPFKAQDHFWGCDHGMSAAPPLENWFKGYRELVENLKGVEILNISENTYVPQDVIPRDDWKKYAKFGDGKWN